MMNPRDYYRFLSLMREVNSLSRSIDAKTSKLIEFLDKNKLELLGNTNTTLSCAKSIDTDKIDLSRYVYEKT